MKPAQVKSIQSLARGLEVLQLLQTTGALTLAELHKLSGIPKASLLRILKTLMEQGMVWQRMADNAYFPSFSLSELAGRMTREQELVEAASPVLEKLSERVQWPSVLAVPRLTHMEVIETNASRTMIDDVPLGPIGFQINMMRSASGRAYLAACETPIREATLRRLQQSKRPGDRFARHSAYVDALCADYDRRGFAFRDPDFGGDYEFGRDANDDGRDSLAVPIMLGRHVPGVINITWSQRVFNREKATALFAEHVLHAAGQIAQKLTLA